LLAWADLSLESVHCRGALTCSALSHALQRFRHAVDRFGIKCSAGQERTDRHNTAPHGNLRAQKKRQASRPSISAPRQGVSRHERRGRAILFGHHRAPTDALGTRCGLATPPTGVDHAANRENSLLLGWVQFSMALALGTEHKCGVTDTLDFFWQPTTSTTERYQLCGRLVHARLPAPLPTHRGPGMG
jgi:hypothetical protein